MAVADFNTQKGEHMKKMAIGITALAAVFIATPAMAEQLTETPKAAKAYFATRSDHFSTIKEYVGTGKTEAQAQERMFKEIFSKHNSKVSTEQEIAGKIMKFVKTNKEEVEGVTVYSKNIVVGKVWFGVNHYCDKNLHGLDKCYYTFEIVKTK